MMKRIIQTALRLRIVVVALMLLLMVVGYQVLKSTPLDVFPEFSPPYVEIQTEAPGLSTAEVEALISVPLENALNGTPQVQNIRSKSVLGLSSVVLHFDKSVNVMDARQSVQERLSRVAPLLPAVAKPPVMLSPLSSTSRVLKIGITSDSVSQMDMTTLVRWTVRPRLMAIPGIANVAIWGQRDRQIQVLVNPEKLQTLNVSLNDVNTATRDAVALAGGGFMDTPNQRMAVSNVPAIKNASDLKKIVVAYRKGAAITLGDVATVIEGFPAPIGDAVVNSKRGLLLVVEKQPGANTLEVTRNVEEVLNEMKPGLKGLVLNTGIFRPATFIETSLHNLNTSLIIGCVLVIVVLWFFLYDWRTALISATALPCSLIVAALIIHYTGETINTMVLAGLIIALGEVVDDAIIDVENIMRRLRENRALGNPKTHYQVVFDASIEVRSAVIYGSIIIAFVLMPVFLLPGLAGAFFHPLALSYILAILASLVVALTLTPALSLLLLPQAKERAADPPVVHWLKVRYEKILRRQIHKPKQAVWLPAIVTGLALLILPFLGEEFMPDFKENDFLMHWIGKPGTSLEAMARITTQVSKELRAIPGVRNFGAHVGRAEVGEEVAGPNFTELWISIDPKADYEATEGKIQKVMEGYPGIYHDMLTYLHERIEEVLTGTSSSVVVRVYGTDLGKLFIKAKEIGDALKKVDGVIELKVQQQTMVPQIEVRFRPEAGNRFGVKPGDILRTVSTLVKGAKAGELYQEQKIFDVVVWGAPEVRNNLGAIQAMLIETPTGARVPLRDLADVFIVPTPNEITREASSRRIDITCNVRGRDLGSVVRDIEAKIQGISFETGYHPEILGEYAERRKSQSLLMGLAAISVLGIFLVLYTDFGSFRLAILILLSLLFSLTGCIIAAVLSGGNLSLGSMVGFITVLGIAARNSIMLVSHYRYLETEEHMEFGEELIFKGAMERMSPIIMTSLTAVLALLPIIIGGNRPGQEIEHPMAIIIWGGLITSTVLNLVFMPALYWRYGKAPLKASNGITDIT